MGIKLPEFPTLPTPFQAPEEPPLEPELPPLPEWVSKRIATVENFALGRFYTYDIFMLWRVISGTYYRSPIMFFASVGGNLISDSLELLGTRGLNDRIVAFLDEMTIYYNELIQEDLESLYPNSELWEGWERFTQMLRQDYKERPGPLSLPELTAELPLVELSATEIENLTLTEKTAYFIYKGDVVYMERAHRKASACSPDFFLMLKSTWRDLEGMFNLFTEWARERFLGEPASNEARIMGKVILLADYKF